MRPDPDQRHRLVAILDNLRERPAEAHHKGWRGKVAGLEVSIAAATSKLRTMDELRHAHQVTHLGMPDFRTTIGRNITEATP